MTRIKDILSILLFVPFIVNAGSPLKKITVEFPVSPQHELPENIQSLLLINRTANSNYSNLKADSLQNIFYRNSFNLDTAIYDFAAVDTSLHALGIMLYESGRYDITIPDNPFFVANKNYSLSDVMSWAEIRNLCKTFNTDAIVSMDMLQTNVKTELWIQKVYDHYKDAYVNMMMAQIAVSYKTIFRVYAPTNEQILACEPIADTLYWEKSATDIYDIFENLTSIKQALAEAAINMAIDYSEKISPDWQKAKRVIYFKGNDSFEQAANLAYSGNWENAITIWKNILKDEKVSKNKKSKILFNLANAYEIQGDLNTAIKYATESHQTMYHEITWQYLEILAKRKKELQKK